MKNENNWKHKSLSSLLKSDTPKFNTEDESYLLKTCRNLIKKPIIEFTIEDLRILISQSIGLNYLIQIAIEKLETNILSEGDFYEGDLLKSVLTSDENYWKVNLTEWHKMCKIFTENIELLKNFDTSWSIKKDWFDGFEKFNNYN